MHEWIVWDSVLPDDEAKKTLAHAERSEFNTTGMMGEAASPGSGTIRVASV
jgi:hypothetical protein